MGLGKEELTTVLLVTFLLVGESVEMAGEGMFSAVGSEDLRGKKRRTF